jgi:hypothetical protein
MVFGVSRKSGISGAFTQKLSIDKLSGSRAPSLGVRDRLDGRADLDLRAALLNYGCRRCRRAVYANDLGLPTTANPKAGATTTDPETRCTAAANAQAAGTTTADPET